MPAAVCDANGVLGQQRLWRNKCLRSAEEFSQRLDRTRQPRPAEREASMSSTHQHGRQGGGRGKSGERAGGVGLTKGDMFLIFTFDHQIYGKLEGVVGGGGAGGAGGGMGGDFFLLWGAVRGQNTPGRTTIFLTVPPENIPEAFQLKPCLSSAAAQAVLPSLHTFIVSVLQSRLLHHQGLP